MLRDAGNNVDENHLLDEQSSMNINEQSEDSKEEKSNYEQFICWRISIDQL